MYKTCVSELVAGVVSRSRQFSPEDRSDENKVVVVVELQLRMMATENDPQRRESCVQKVN